jgi:putative redox protein
MSETPNAHATTTGLGTFQNRIDINGTWLVADEPEALGGLGTGPGPYDLLAAALAACTNMTLRLHAERKGWHIGEVATQVTYRRTPGQVPADHFARHITLTPDLDPAIRDELLAIAERCPVHKTLSAGSAISTALVAL